MTRWVAVRFGVRLGGRRGPDRAGLSGRRGVRWGVVGDLSSGDQAKVSR